MANATTAPKSLPPRPEFAKLAEPLRCEMKVHCYRMLGSLHEAEDFVQETFLRGWRGFDNFEGGSFRAWLYRIATNACLNALESRKNARRWLPDQRTPASTTPEAAPVEIAWLEPYPDSELENIADEAPHPEARYASRETTETRFRRRDPGIIAAAARSAHPLRRARMVGRRGRG